MAAFLGILVVAAVMWGIAPRFDALDVTCDSGRCAPQQLTAFEASRVRDSGLTLDRYAAFVVVLEVLGTLGWFVFAGMLLSLRRASTVTIAAALALMSFGATFSGFLDALASRGNGWSVLVAGLNWLGFVSLTGFLLLFPDGRVRNRSGRWLLPLAAVLFAGIYAAPGDVLDPKTSIPGVVIVLVILGIAVAMQVSRYRHVSGPVERQQTKWVVAGLVALVVGFALVIALDVINHEVYGFSVSLYATELLFFAVVKLLLPVSLVLAIRRHRLWDIDTLINRTLVYAALTFTVVGTYVLIVGYLGSLFRSGDNLPVSLVATAVVAVIFQPVWNRIQRSVNRLMYGDRDDPYTVIANLGDRLEAALAPETVLPTIVDTIRDALRVPYAAIAVRNDQDRVIGASAGAPAGVLLQLPLTVRGEEVGQLMVAPRDPGEPWAPTDLRLLQELARQAGVAVQGLQLTRELQLARERLVRSREDERRRLRGDLHDDLAPTLASLSLTAATARALVDRDPEGARQLMADVQTAARSAVAEVRRIVYDLRPPTLDELGLVGAIRAGADRYTRHDAATGGDGGEAGLRVEVHAAGELPGIPAAVEVAAYRIVQEALSNVARHSGAASCVIRMRLDEESQATSLEIDVEDDGLGIPADAPRGVGIASMTERAAELGGMLEVIPAEPHGTRIHARLPMTKEDR